MVEKSQILVEINVDTSEENLPDNDKTDDDTIFSIPEDLPAQPGISSTQRLTP